VQAKYIIDKDNSEKVNRTIMELKEKMLNAVEGLHKTKRNK